MVLFLAYNIEHLKWVKDYKNELFSNEPNFYEEYFNDVYFSDKKCLENFRNFVGNNMIFAHNAMRDMEFINNDYKDFSDEKILNSLNNVKSFSIKSDQTWKIEMKLK